MPGRCSYCLRVVAELENEHVEPRARGGVSDSTNLVPSCYDCNRAKGTTSLLDFVARYGLAPTPVCRAAQKPERIPLPEGADYYTTAQVAADLGISPIRVRQLRSSHKVGTLYGRDWLFSPADVAAMRERTNGRPRKTPA